MSRASALRGVKNKANAERRKERKETEAFNKNDGHRINFGPVGYMRTKPVTGRDAILLWHP